MSGFTSANCMLPAFGLHRHCTQRIKLKTDYAKDFINGRIRAGKRIDNEWSKEDSD